MSSESSPTSSPTRRLPTGIWALGFCSLFMDMSSELIHSLLPVFLTTVLGAGMLTIGLLEGVAEATAAFVKVGSGALSDRIRKRKALAVAGYGLAALTKPVFALAPTVGWVFGARFADRIGKGIRGAPRDALIADITPAGLRGAAYGLRQALDSAGALLGPLLALALMALLANDLRAVLWVAAIPAALAVVVLVVAVREPPQDAATPGPLAPTLAGVGRLPRAFWQVAGLGALFTLARFSEAFLVLRAQDVGLGIGLVPLVMVVMNIGYAGVAYPAGAAADRLDRRTLLLAGLALLVVADLVLALARGPVVVLAGALLWGLHMAATQGLLSKLVADAAPAALRGTAFGLFHLVSGVALLAASVIAGALWSAHGPAATFLAGAIFAALAAAAAAVVLRPATA